MKVEIPGSPALHVSWSCRRCGHTGGVARTTMPIVDRTWTEAMMRELLASLRRKLVRIHQRSSMCVATPDDFVIAPGGPEDKRLIGRV